ncbi:conserved domain protein [Haemophilus pittmaniae HK 85]|uniref:Conserved domain protein n=1 Tax=Haemophilus pittmaniae HK 85 TaxID=1035188 RepID=F9Q6I1_9PAST|nr:conserved domain protein [Haemophilus pittmaniae HK 85]
MHNIDALDQQILRVLTKDARTPYAEMAKSFGVSPGTIHVRVEKCANQALLKVQKPLLMNANSAMTCVVLLASS